MRSARAVWAAVLIGMSFSVIAQDETAPELDFLEYLGSWQETDEEWLVVSEWDPEAPPEQDEKRKRKSKEDE